MGTMARFWERDLSVTTCHILLKLMFKFKMAFSRQAKKASESDPSIPPAFTKSLVHSQPRAETKVDRISASAQEHAI